MSDGELITGIPELEALAPEWDALAVAASNPAGAPSWVLAWWRHVAEGGIEPRVVVVRDRGELIGLVPFYARATGRGVVEYRLMAGEFGMSLEPLALPGREWEVAAHIGRELAGATPTPAVLGLGPITMASHWVPAIQAQWPGRVLGVVRRQRTEGVPVIVLREPSYEEWLESLPPKIRRDLRRCERMFEEAGGTTRLSTADTFSADVQAFVRLHGSRWGERGWSRLLDLGDRLEEWFEDLGSETIATGRLHMCVLEVDGTPICVCFSLVAGDEFATVNLGWDESYARLAPAKLAMARDVQGAYRLGCGRVHLGKGDHPNKLRLANGNDPVAWTLFMPPSARLPQAYGSALPELVRGRTRDALERALPRERFEALKGLKARLRPDRS